MFVKKIIIKIITFVTSHICNVIKSKNRLNPIEKFKKDTALESYNYFKKYFAKANLFKVSDNVSKEVSCSIELFEFVFSKIFKNNLLKDEYLILEFGTFKGESAKVISAILRKGSKSILHTFDSFEGLSEPWYGTSKYEGTFKLNNIPSLPSNCKIIKGLIQNTLKSFLQTHEKKIAFLHCDVDTYETTKYILVNSKKYFMKGSIIVFDDLHNRAGWKEGQIKALNEVFQDDEYTFLAFSDSGQAAIEIK